MGQTDIIELLNKAFPKYLSYKDIIKELDLSRRTVIRNLSKLRKRNEIEYIIIKSKTSHGVWITKYRIKR